jgi:hypothetical protein
MKTASRFPSTALSELTEAIPCAPLPPSRGDALRPIGFSHRLRDEKNLVYYNADTP